MFFIISSSTTVTLARLSGAFWFLPAYLLPVASEEHQHQIEHNDASFQNLDFHFLVWKECDIICKYNNDEGLTIQLLFAVIWNSDLHQRASFPLMLYPDFYIT